MSWSSGDGTRRAARCPYAISRTAPPRSVRHRTDRPTTANATVQATAPPGRREAVDRPKEEHGGIKWGSAFFGFLTATGVGVLLTAVVSATLAAVGVASGTSTSQAEQTVTSPTASTMGLVSGITLLVVLFVAYYCGGYVANRMARFARQQREVDLCPHPPQCVDLGVAVPSHAEVDLSHRTETTALDDVDQHRDLDAVPRHEGDLLEELAASGVLPRKGLHDTGEHRPVQDQQRPRDQLGHPAPARGQHDLTGVQRAVVKRLHDGRRPHPSATVRAG